MQTLKLAEDVFDALYEGKSVTIRKGKRDIKIGKLLFESIEQNRKCVVDVIGVDFFELKNVPQEDLLNDGFNNTNEMLHIMKRFYPDIEYNTEVTIIRFKN